MTMRKLGIFIAASIAVGSAWAQESLPPSLRKEKARELLCVPERLWTCNGIGECFMDDRPDTLAAWKFDVPGKRWAMCKRDGTGCAEWFPLASVKDSAFLVIHESGWHPEMFKIDRDTGKFAAVRLSGGFQDISDNPATTDVSALLIRQRVGICVVTKK